VIDPERVKDELPDDAQISGDPVPSAGGLQTNNPGWPGFSSGGWMLGGTLYVAVAF
jgi:long-chain fatty acid transport protein